MQLLSLERKVWGTEAEEGDRELRVALAIQQASSSLSLQTYAQVGLCTDVAQ